MNYNNKFSHLCDIIQCLQCDMNQKIFVLYTLYNVRKIVKMNAVSESKVKDMKLF